MKAIRPIYDGQDDLDNLDCIDHIDMMVCLFGKIYEILAGMDDNEKTQLNHMIDSEIMPKEYLFGDECESHPETGFEELIFMFEIVRWLEECGYEWRNTVSARYKYIAKTLGIISDASEKSIELNESDEYILNVGIRAFHELKLMLPLHWATILLDWHPTMINRTSSEKVIQYGKLMIICDEKLLIPFGTGK